MPAKSRRRLPIGGGSAGRAEAAPNRRQTARRLFQESRVLARRVSPSPRALPSFLIIGAQRCGTTSLYSYLSRHPDVRTPVAKELQYFSYRSARPTDWYRAHFPRAADGIQTFEATPYYLFHPAAPARAHGVVPHAKLLVLLRDPVARAFSHYQHNVGYGLESLPFEAALDAEEERLAGEAERLAADPHYPGVAHRRYSYVSRGCYAEQLERWLQWFPRDQLMLIVSEDFYRDTDGVFGLVVAFLGLRPFRLSSYPAETRRRPWLGPALSEQSRRRLRERFEGPNRRLAEVLGRDPGWHG